MVEGQDSPAGELCHGREAVQGLARQVFGSPWCPALRCQRSPKVMILSKIHQKLNIALGLSYILVF
jgi:hypothetical protein